MVYEYKITTIQTVMNSTYLYLIVEFYLNGKLTHTEDFIIGRSREKRVYIGQIGPNGEILDPLAYDVTPTDIKTEIQGVIIAFEKRHRGSGLLTGNATNRVSEIRRDNTDPHGFVARPEIQAIKNVTTKL